MQCCNLEDFCAPFSNTYILFSNVGCYVSDTLSLSLSLIGQLAIPSVIPRLPFGTNHLGISEETIIALLCCLMELCTDSFDNAR